VSRTQRRKKHIVLATALLGVVAGAILAAALSAGTAPAQAAVANIELVQTCPNRVQPNTNITVNATVRNTGDEALTVTRVDGDAGTTAESDDFVLAYQSGDTNGNNLLDPGETWRYSGSYAVGDEDSTNNAGVDAVSTAGNFTDDLDSCVTDVAQDPVPGVLAGVQPVGGTVLVQVPGTNRFVRLNNITEIPVGSQIDATRGTVRLTSAVTRTQTTSALFFSGRFTIRQRRAARALMQLILGGGNFGVCRRGSSAQSISSADARPRRSVRRLWGSGTGRFQTRGRYSSATVRGTRWLTEDRCDGTLTRVLQGRVVVQDFPRRRTITLRAGRSYLAGPRR
jgi:hypothetical protein